MISIEPVVANEPVLVIPPPDVIDTPFTESEPVIFTLPVN